MLEHANLVYKWYLQIFQKHIDSLFQIYVRFPKPTHFQCVYHMYMLDFILCYNDIGKYKTFRLFGIQMNSEYISYKENIPFCSQWSIWGMRDN